MEKKSFFKIGLMAVLTFVASSSFSQTNTAAFSADCRSFQMNTISYVDEFLDTVNYYFTTYDGSTNYPSKIDYPTNGIAVLSGEFSPITNGPGQFRSTYISTSTGQPGLFSYGTYVFNLSSNDSNANGLLDVTEFSAAVSNNFIMSSTQLGPGTNFANVISGTLVRPSNSFSGTFSLVTSNTIISSNIVTGTWQLLSMIGTVSYTRGLTNTISLSLTNSTNSFTASTTFTVSNANVVVLPSFQLTSADSNVLTVAAGTTFKRTNGNSYIATAIFQDGYIATTFADYTNWVFQFTDTNDINGNGVPDFSDALVSQFFNGAIPLGGNVYYLTFTNGTPFGFYNLYNFPYFYHYDFGFEYFIDANNAASGGYLYDFSSSTFFYTEPGLWPYLYDFTLNSWLYYYPNPASPGSYSSNPRVFYEFRTGQTINK